MTANGTKRVAITGMGAITPLGLDVNSTWEACRSGTSGIAPITLFDASEFPTRIAGEVKGFDPVAAVGQKEARRSSRCIQLALVAAREAVADSGLDVAALGDEVGVLVASGIGGLEFLDRASIALHDHGVRRVSPFTIPGMIPDMPAGMIAIEHGAKGPNYAIVSACASGGHALGEAAEWIRRGDAVAVVAGGTEASVTGLGIGSFNAMQALSTRNDEPARASRPFDRERDGFVMGEGSGILVLEDWEHARERGARIYAEITGYGATADAGHITQPNEDGDGARRSIVRALQRAGREPEEVGYINAHGTSTQLNDAAETRAVHAALGEAAQTIPMSSTKSMHGHLLGAAGAIEAVITVCAIQDQFVPPTINLDEPDPECDLDYVPHRGRNARIDFALSTSFGFGGHNVCVGFARVNGA
ncbi:MAG: beta-ketoacyl-ACP synthase II [Candidatus Dormibacteraeota bacterium]|nr:beta-ketoacyl-ACP synthase II [Candidatus Dormibacteraeota bacterium]